MSRIVIDVSGEQHQRIKALASLQGKSIKDYVLERVLPDEEAAINELTDILGQRIISAEQNPPAKRSFEDVTQQILSKNG